MAIKINIIAAGILKDNSLKQILLKYLKRITLFKISIAEIDDKNLSKLKINEKLFKNIDFTKHTVIVLDELGIQLSSHQLAQTIENHTNKTIIFIVGGSEGIDHSLIKDKPNIIVLSLSKLTFPHQLVQVILAEQLYRAETIIKGHPYHR